jgi:hypothetical protein
LAGRSKCVNREAPKYLTRVERIAGGLGVPSCSDLGEGHVGIEVWTSDDRAPRGHRERHAKKEWSAKARNHPRVASALPHSEGIAYKLLCSEIAMCSRVGRMGSISDDGSRQHNSDKSEDPWGGGTTQPPWRCTIARSPRHSAGLSMRPEVHERRTQTAHQSGYAGSRLKPVDAWEGAARKPAFQPYRGKPAVRNDREGRGNVGIIRSPVRASTLPD